MAAYVSFVKQESPKMWVDWPDQCKGSFNIVVHLVLRGSSSLEYGVFLTPTTTRINMAVMGVFVRRYFRKDTVVMYHYSSPVYRYLKLERCNTVFCGYGTMGVTAERFRDTSLVLPVQVRDDGGTIHKVWIMHTLGNKYGYSKKRIM